MWWCQPLEKPHKSHFFIRRNRANLRTDAGICGKRLAMPWIETDEHNRALLSALTELVAERGALDRLAGAINADERALTTERARKGIKHKDRLSLVASSTLARWQEEGLARITDAQPHKKRIVYEFLERSPEFRTQLYRPEGTLPSGFLTFSVEHAERLSQFFKRDLRNLDGVFQLYRHPISGDRKRVLVSRLLITTVDGFTRFREEQDFTDSGFLAKGFDQSSAGAVLFAGDSLLLLGFGMDADAIKLFVCESWRGSLDSRSPIIQISGKVMIASGRKEVPVVRFVAIRSEKSADETEVGSFAISDPRVGERVLSYLDLSS